MEKRDFERIAAKEHYLVVVTTLRRDGLAQSSVVNAGFLRHPTAGGPVLGMVLRGGTVKLRNLRRDSRITVTARSGHEWASLDGQADIIGPDDLPAGFAPAALPTLLRQVFAAAGGTHDNWAEYDRVMAQQRRAAVFVSPTHVYGNQPR
ncbi:MAG: TIGR03618 family F420-dependent PPOX class oxidoreductase [Chloroflexota bacterium]